MWLKGLVVAACLSGLVLMSCDQVSSNDPLPQVAALEFSMAAGSYVSTQSLTITCTTTGVTIYYTTDGSDPTAASTTYTGVIAIDASMTIKAFAVLAGWTSSPIMSADYVIQVASPTFSPVAGTYTAAQLVAISCATPGATIYYTTTGIDPTAASSVYSAPLAIPASVTLKALALKTGLTDSDIAQSAYVIQIVEDPTFTPAPGTYTAAQSVTIACATAGATIHYTTDGSNPTTGSTVYAAPIAVADTTTIKALAVNAGWGDSGIATGAYVIQIVEDTAFSPPPGTYDSSVLVTITCATPGAVIYYTTDGSTPTPSSDLYSAPINVDAALTLQAIAIKDGFGDSTVVTGVYTITVATPAFTPVAGTYTSTRTVTIACATPGATIRYTIDGSDPTTGSNLYTSGIPISVPTTLKAFAYKTGLVNSAIATGDYVIQVATPTFSPAPGSYAAAQSVVISCATAGSTIHYTINNTTPTTGSPVYSAPIGVSTNTTIRALAVKASLVNSNVASASYVITTEQVQTPSFSPAPALYTNVTNVTVTCATAGASIYYTTNGAAPTTSSTPYTGPILGTMDITRTIRTFATHAGMLNSNEATGVYTLPDVDGDGLSGPMETYWHTSDSSADSDADGIDDDEEIGTWGTRPDLDDTDGDGVPDGVELIDYGYASNWTTQTYRFSPLIADVPQINISLQLPPAIVANVTTSTVTSESVSAERSVSSADTVKHADTSTHSRSVEETHNVESSFSLTGWVPSFSGSYSYSNSTTREESVSYTTEQSQENTRAWSKMQTRMHETGYTYNGGEIQATVKVENRGALSVEMTSLALMAGRAIPSTQTVEGLCNMTTTGITTLPVAGGSESSALLFTGSVLQGPMEQILANPNGLIIKPASYTLNVLDQGGNTRAFTHNFNAIDSNCARIVIDYGPYDAATAVGWEPPERHYVACNLRYGSSDGITLREAFENHMHLNDAAIGTTYNSYAMGSVQMWISVGGGMMQQVSRSGLMALRGLDERTVTNGEWVIVHRYMVGAEEHFAGYRVRDASYSLDNIVLHAGDVVQILYMKDSDNDKLGIREEYALGSSDNDTDSDDDGLSDWDEAKTYHSDPNNPNSPVYKYTVTLASITNTSNVGPPSYTPTAITGRWTSQTRYGGAWLPESSTYDHINGTVSYGGYAFNISYTHQFDRDNLGLAEVWLWADMNSPANPSAASLTIPRSSIYQATTYNLWSGVAPFYNSTASYIVTPIY